MREDGGIVETIETSVVIEALPTAIPPSISLDISEMVVGDTLKIADLPTVEGVVYVDDDERPLVTVLAPRIIEEEVPVEGEELAEEGAMDEAAASAETADEGGEG